MSTFKKNLFVFILGFIFLLIGGRVAHAESLTLAKVILNHFTDLPQELRSGLIAVIDKTFPSEEIAGLGEKIADHLRKKGVSASLLPAGPTPIPPIRIEVQWGNNSGTISLPMDFDKLPADMKQVLDDFLDSGSGHGGGGIKPGRGLMGDDSGGEEIAGVMAGKPALDLENPDLENRDEKGLSRKLGVAHSIGDFKGKLGMVSAVGQDTVKPYKEDPIVANSNTQEGINNAQQKGVEVGENNEGNLAYGFLPPAGMWNSRTAPSNIAEAGVESGNPKENGNAFMAPIPEEGGGGPTNYPIDPSLEQGQVDRKFFDPRKVIGVQFEITKEAPVPIINPKGTSNPEEAIKKEDVGHIPPLEATTENQYEYVNPPAQK